MKSWGPDMPPRNPAADARAAHAAMVRGIWMHHLELQAKAAADGLLEALRTAGVVLFVMDVVGVRDASWTVVALLLAAPQLFGLALLLAIFARRRWIAWRVARAVR